MHKNVSFRLTLKQRYWLNDLNKKVPFKINPADMLRAGMDLLMDYCTDTIEVDTFTNYVVMKEGFTLKEKQ